MMTTAGRVWPVLGALSGLASVIAGALAVHGVADPTAREWLRTGSGYEMGHALAIFACLFVGGRRALIAAGLFLAGTVLFSGSLYALALGAPRFVGLATPVGGLALMAGWLALAWAGLDAKRAGGLPPA